MNKSLLAAILDATTSLTNCADAQRVELLSTPADSQFQITLYSGVPDTPIKTWTFPQPLLD